MVIGQRPLFETDAGSAVFSHDRVYRYELWRWWSRGPYPYVQFIGLNPSTADETTDDNTIRKCVKFAKTWGYAGMCMTNLFAYRATKPKEMIAHLEPIGPANDKHLERVASQAFLIVAAWSQHGDHQGRARAVEDLLRHRDLYALRVTKGEPWHPLYLPDVTEPTIYRRSI